LPDYPGVIDETGEREFHIIDSVKDPRNTGGANTTTAASNQKYFVCIHRIPPLAPRTRDPAAHYNGFGSIN
tara:strand:+ start:526 stop:738 length:213 start_codon:yes stop_codon:yes gene_type:complete